jgi:hypothetical protein
MSAAPGKFCVYITAALMIAGGADAEPSACKQASFLFAKLAAASTNCHLQASKSLALYADVAKHFCGPGPASKWPGLRAGAMVFYTEVKELGREAVCERISREMISLENSAKTTPTECWGPPGEDFCGSHAEVEKYKRAYKKGADCSSPGPVCSGPDCPTPQQSRQACEDAKAGKLD